MKPLLISAPFGNYIQPSYATATLGTFTLHPRPGRVSQILKTVRYYPKIGAWTNQIGLRNPGVSSLFTNVVDISDKVVSIHGFTDAEWEKLIHIFKNVKKPMAIELNLSCPNVPGGDDYPKWLFQDAMQTHVPVIVKLPPVNYSQMFHDALNVGVTMFHCTNTIPTAGGGISGKPLKPIALSVVRDVRGVAPKAFIIGGGGITTPNDVDEYAAAGANAFAVGSGSLWYWRLRGLAERTSLLTSGVG